MAKWIWHNEEIKKDSYCYFESSFISNEKKAFLKISVDSDYMVYVNNKLVAFDQYPCFPFHPIYDEIIIPCKIGINSIKIIVYYCGGDSFSTYHYSDKPGLFFEIKQNDRIILESNSCIKSTSYNIFEDEHESIITPQMGYRLFADLSKKIGELNNSLIIDKPLPMDKRDNQKCKLSSKLIGQAIKKEDNYILFDLGREETGYLDFVIKSYKKQKILITWGEHIVDGKVRYLIGNRNFSFEITLKRGVNRFFQTFKRFGCRYIEIHFNEPIEIIRFGLRTYYYPFKKISRKFSNELRNQIYETAVHTLECCYHDHFEDCPWREQAFYPMDSRNQAIYHSTCFKNKETIKSAIKLVAFDNREDGLLRITIPANFNLTIPSYSLYFPELCYFYAKQYKDKETLEIIYPKLISITQTFINNMSHNLVKNFKGDGYWNFYEWVEGLDFLNESIQYDAVLNSLFILHLTYMDKINVLLGKKVEYKDLINKVRRACRNRFFVKENGLFVLAKKDTRKYQLVNTLASLAGIVNKEKQLQIADNLLKNNGIIKSSLAFKPYLYDLLIKLDKKKYRDYILNDIDTTFKNQLDKGATTFWETSSGESDFDGAGSLCHGWNAYAAYYYQKLKA